MSDRITCMNTLEGRQRLERELATGSWTLAVMALLVAPPTAASPQLISSGDLTDLAWPGPDARVSYGEGPLQFGYLRLPEGGGPHPVIVFIHGGCWLSVYDIRHAGPAERALADAGYAVWSLEDRRVGDEGGGWPGTFLDVARGVDHLSELAREYPLDLDRVIASGHSAGGHPALWAAARPGIPSSSELYTVRPLPIHGVLTLAPAPNLETLHDAGVCGNVVNSLMGGSPDVHSERYNVGSPMRLMPVGVPQRLIVGAHDRAWGPQRTGLLRTGSRSRQLPGEASRSARVGTLRNDRAQHLYLAPRPAGTGESVPRGDECSVSR